MCYHHHSESIHLGEYISSLFMLSYVLACRFDHFGRLHDVQTLAMLACVFQLHCLHYEEQHNNTANMNNYVNTSAYTNGSTQAKPHGPVGQGGPSPPKRVSQNHTNERGQEIDAEFQEKEDRQEEMSSHERNCR